MLDDYPKSLDMIRQEVGISGLTYPEMMELLIKLCVKGMAEQMPGGNVYRRK